MSSSLKLATMLDVEEFVAERRKVLSGHEFLRRLEGPGDLAAIRRMAPRLAAFVMCFQDVLRLAYEHCRDPELKEMAREHRLEDQGHDIWYLHDLKKLGAALDVGWMFSDAHELTRDVAYAQIALVLTCRDDRTRLSVVLALEAIGAEFFGSAIGFLERSGYAEGLRYFAHSHRLIEASHQVFEEKSRRRLAAIAVPDSVVGEVERSVDSVFEGMSRLASDLAQSLQNQ